MRCPADAGCCRGRPPRRCSEKQKFPSRGLRADVQRRREAKIAGVPDDDRVARSEPGARTFHLSSVVDDDDFYRHVGCASERPQTGECQIRVVPHHYHDRDGGGRVAPSVSRDPLRGSSPASARARLCGPPSRALADTGSPTRLARQRSTAHASALKMVAWDFDTPRRSGLRHRARCEQSEANGRRVTVTQIRGAAPSRSGFDPVVTHPARDNP